MSTRNEPNERGGVLLETLLAILLLVVFTVGALGAHAAFHRRFERIVAARNSAVRAARVATP